MRHAKAFYLTCTAMLTGTMGAVAHAQTAEPTTESQTSEEQVAAGSGEIIVTAQRRAERLVDVPVSVTALNSVALEKVSTTGLFDVTKLSPGVVINRNGGYLQPTIRGIGTSVVGGAADTNVAVYLDGVYQASQIGNFFDLPNVQQLEILKGPQGTLFGRNATGGAILLTTADPSFTTKGRFTASYGRFNEAKIGAYVTTPLTDNLAGDISVYYRRSDGFKRDVLTNDLVAKQSSFDIRSKLLWRPTDTTEVVLSAAYNETSDPTGLALNALDGNTQARLALNPGPIAEGRKQLSQDVRPEVRTKVKSATLTIDQELGIATLRSISGFRDEDAHIEGDLDASYVPVQETRFDQLMRTFSQEFTLTSPSAGDFRWVAGVFYYHARAFTPAFVVNKITTGAPSFRSLTNVDALAGFVDGTYDIGKLTLISGLRYSTERRRLRFNFGITGPYTTDAEKRFGSWTPRVGLRYKVGDQANVYATYSKGFKSGLFNTSSPSTVPVKPEKVDSYEIGFKSAERTIDLNLAAYYYSYKNIQITAFDFTSGASRLFNAARAEIYGAEAELNVRPSSKFDVRMAAAYTHGVYDQFQGALIFTPRPGGRTGNITAIVDASGSTMIRAPKFTLSSTANYRVPLNQGTLEFSATAYYTSKINYSYDERIQQPAYATVDANVTWLPSDQFSVSIWGRNLTDTNYGSFLTSTSARDSIVYAAPLSYGISASYKF